MRFSSRGSGIDCSITHAAAYSVGELLHISISQKEKGKEAKEDHQKKDFGSPFASFTQTLLGKGINVVRP